MNDAHLADTTSLCPTCLERVPGTYESRDGAVYLTRSCPDHGIASRKVWESLEHWEWAQQFGPGSDAAADGTASEDTCCGPGTSSSADGCCSVDGGSAGAGAADGRRDDGSAERLRVAGDHACLAVVEITQDCNLSCSYCFASSGPGGTQLPVEDVLDRLETVRREGGTRPIQFSGGEPTVHDRLPELVERARGMGFDHVEVNTNGIAIARREGYADRLADAGVTAIYLQFDGLERDTYREIREADLLAVKHAAVEACRDAGLPVILVPTVVPRTNDDEMGDVVRFALENLDVVQSINFQPVAHFGRYADHHGRFSLDEVARRLADQVDRLEARDFLPVPCCSSYCQLSTAVMPADDGGVFPLAGILDVDDWNALSGLIDEADWMELLAGTPAGRETVELASSCCDFEVPGGEAVLPITLTGFMDADAADADRLENCCISVPTPDGELVPFCGYNMTTEDGRYALRNRHDWGGRDHVTGEGASAQGDPDGARADGAGQDANPRAGDGNG